MLEKSYLFTTTDSNAHANGRNFYRRLFHIGDNSFNYRLHLGLQGR